MINAARALTHDSKYTICSVSILLHLRETRGRTEHPKEGRDKRENRMAVCILHGLERRSEGVLHGVRQSLMMTYFLYVAFVGFDNGRQEKLLSLTKPAHRGIRLNAAQSRFI